MADISLQVAGKKTIYAREFGASGKPTTGHLVWSSSSDTVFNVESVSSDTQSCVIAANGFVGQTALLRATATDSVWAQETVTLTTEPVATISLSETP